MKKSILSITLVLFTALVLFSQDSPVLMTIADDEVTLAEFERIYKKNNNDNSLSKQSPEEYLDLFIKFKLKVKEAEALGMDTTTKFINELEGEYEELKGLVEVESAENQLTIRMMGEATFDTGRADLRSEFIPLLLKIGEALGRTRAEIIIAGHTDNVPLSGGPFGSNLGLSMARAGAVAEFLLSKNTIDPKRLSTMGFGEYRPLTSNDTAEGRRKNRRVEIIVTM